jgi:hypothetical protein
VEWDRRRDKRGRKTVPVEIPPVEATIPDDSPSGVATSAGGEQGTPPNDGASPTGPTGAPASNSGPPPLDVVAPKPIAAPSTPKKEAPKKVVPTAIGQHVAKLTMTGLAKWGASIEARGGFPYPEELYPMTAISVAWLADKYLGALGEEEALHWINALTPVGWNLWFGRKGAKAPSLFASTETSPDAPAKSADGPKEKEPASKSEGDAASIPRDPPPPHPIAHNPSREEREKIRAAMGSL